MICIVLGPNTCGNVKIMRLAIQFTQGKTRLRIGKCGKVGS
jgi:hypothetical protein